MVTARRESAADFKKAPSSVVADASCFEPPAYTRSNVTENVDNRLSYNYEDLRRQTPEHPTNRLPLRSQDPSLYYDMSGDKILIIFNHFKYMKTRHNRKSLLKPREGTYKDVTRLEETFRRLGFIVITHDDWQYKDIMNYLNYVCQKDHSNTSCVAVAVMTHGKGSRLSAADRKYPVTDITDTLRSAPSLAGKPKLFFFQACRTGHTEPKHGLKDRMDFSMNADSLLLYSTYEDHFSYRDKDGSWMMQALCNIIDAHHTDMNLVQMITLVNKEVAKITSDYGKQMPVSEFNLKKFLKL